LDITLELVKKLREKTGAGITDCKKALVESDGDFDKAIEFLRKKGAATSQKRSDRVAKEGLIFAKVNNHRNQAAIIEVNCETDFVAKSDAFINLTQNIVNAVLEQKTSNVENLLNAKLNSGITVQQLIDQTTASVGEKIELKRADYIESSENFFCDYNHLGNKVASIVEISGKPVPEGIELGNDLAMQVVAMKPLTISRNEVSEEMINKEKEIYKIQAINEGKPENIADKIASNKVEKFYEENCLLEQEFVKEHSIAVKDFVKSVSDKTGIQFSVVKMLRYQLGETIS
jgi:elongation factor Ts